MLFNSCPQSLPSTWERLQKGPVLSFYLPVGLWPPGWRCSTLYSMVLQKHWKLLTTESRTIARLEGKRITIPGENLRQSVHHSLCCGWIHDYNFVESTVIVHHYQSTFPSGKRIYQIDSYVLPRFGKGVHTSLHRFWHLKLAHHLAPMAEVTDPLCVWIDSRPPSLCPQAYLHLNYTLMPLMSKW